MVLVGDDFDFPEVFVFPAGAVILIKCQIPRIKPRLNPTKVNAGNEPSRPSSQ